MVNAVENELSYLPSLPVIGAQQSAHSSTFFEDGDKEEKGEKDLSELELEKGDEFVVPEDREFVTGFKLYAILGALLVTEVLVGLDATIVASATAVVANEFHALQDLGFYGSSYLLTCCALQPLFGRAYAYFNKKYTFLFAIFLFELGSIISAVATTSRVFILGRAFQGSGYAGIYIGVLAIASVSIPLRMQPFITSLMACSYGFGAAVGPLAGGALTSAASWRWCFWINVPPGVIAMVIVFFFCNPPKVKQSLSIRQRLARMDWLGAVLLLGSLTCVLMALQEGGILTPWKNARVIGLFVGFFTLLCAFFGLQVYLGDNGSISTRLLRNRSVAFAAFVNFASGATYYSVLYFLPIYFQTVKGSSALQSGIQILPVIALNMLSGVGVGWAVSRTGHYGYAMLATAASTALGAGLLSTLGVSTSPAMWIGAQLFAGAGMGGLYMMSFIATQVLLPLADRSRGSSVVCFAQLFGATIWVSASESIYASLFSKGLHTIPGIDVHTVVESGVSGFRDVVTSEQLPLVVDAAVNGLRFVFLAIAVIGAAGTVASFFVEWRRIDAAEK